MSQTLSRIDGPADAELISAVRGGDVSAYGELFERHVEAARRLARQLVSHGDVDDLVSDAFAKVLGVLQRGGGPDVAFRAYLLTAVRRLHVDRIRASSKLRTTDDLEPFDPGVPFRDTAVEGFENAAAAKAFTSLPERWQLVLWHMEVEGQKPADIAPLLGMTPNSVSALAYRAREGLRQAFLNMHMQDLEEDTCRWTHDHLGAYVRNGLAKRDVAKVEAHLDECRKCMGIYLELVEVNSGLAGILAPLLLGSAGAGYLASAAAGVATKGAALLLLDRAKDVVSAHGPLAAAGSTAAVVAVASGAFYVLNSPDRDRQEAGQEPAGISTPSDSAGPSGLELSHTGSADPRPGDASPGAASSASPTDGPTEGPSPGPTSALTDQPTQDATQDPTQAPSQDPTRGPTQEPTQQPSQEPSPDPSPTDEPSHPPSPTEEPPPPPVVYDLAVNAVDLTPGHPVKRNLEARVSGIPKGYTAALTVTLDGVALKHGAPTGCTSSGRVITCARVGNGDIGPFEIVGIGGPLHLLPSWRATFALEINGNPAADNLKENNTGNNTDVLP